MFEKDELIQLKNVHFDWLFARFIANNQAKDVLSLNNLFDNSSFNDSSSFDDILLAMKESSEFERVKEIFQHRFYWYFWTNSRYF